MDDDGGGVGFVIVFDFSKSMPMPASTSDLEDVDSVAVAAVVLDMHNLLMVEQPERCVSKAAKCLELELKTEPLALLFDLCE